MKGLSFLALLVALSGCGEKPQAASSFADAKARYDYEQGKLDELRGMRDMLFQGELETARLGGKLKPNDTAKKLDEAIAAQSLAVEHARQRLEELK